MLYEGCENLGINHWGGLSHGVGLWLHFWGIFLIFFCVCLGLVLVMVLGSEFALNCERQ